MKLQESNPLGDPPVICDREFRKLPDPLTGLVSAHVHFSVEAELAEAVASRPGSFAAAFIDALDAVDETSLRLARKSNRRFSSSDLEAEIPRIALRAVIV